MACLHTHLPLKGQHSTMPTTSAVCSLKATGDDALQVVQDMNKAHKRKLCTQAQPRTTYIVRTGDLPMITVVVSSK